MEPRMKLKDRDIRNYISSLEDENAQLRADLADAQSDLADAQADLAVAKADVLQLKTERDDFKADPEIVAFKAMNKTAFDALTDPEKFDLIWDVLKVVAGS
jgi:phage shock protein A